MGMSCAVISLVLAFINMLDPGKNHAKDARYKAGNINYEHFWGFAQALTSGLILGIINHINVKTSLIEVEELQQFYASAISACFAPFFILKDISDR